MVEQLIYDLETQILSRIAYYLSRGSLASADWQIKKLSQIGALNRENQKIINKYRSEIITQTKQEVRESAEDILAKIKAHTPKQYKMITALTPQMQTIIQAWEDSASSKVNLSMAMLAQNAGSQYVAAINKASLSVLTGTETLQRAVFQAIGETAESGISAYTDTAGRTWTPEGYVKMVVRTNQRRVATETMLQSAEEGEANLVEVSSHMGARPLCAPYQGRIFWLNTPVDGYDSFYNDTSYGEAAGLLGINCGHMIYPFWEGVSKQTNEPYPEEKNDQAYENSQLQRAAERKIRDYKRQAQVWGDTQGGEAKAAYYKNRVKEAQADMRSLMAKTKGTRQYDREAIYG